MNVAGLRRPVMGTIWAAATVAWALTGTPLQAQVANPNLIPASSGYIVSIPDAPAFWNAWKGNGIYASYKKVMTDPEVAERMSGFNKELSTIESVLGYKLDGDTLSQIFKSADVYASAGDNAGENKVGAVLGISDKEKLGKLLDLAEKAAAEAMNEDAETTGTASDNGAAAADSATTGTNPISSEDYSGVTVKRFTTGEDREIFYALAGDQLLISNTQAEIRALVDRGKAAGEGTETLAGSENFKKVSAALSAQKGEAYMFGSQKAMMEMQEGNLEALRDFTRQFSPIDYYGSSINIEPKEIRSYTHGILAADAANTLVGKNPGDKPLAVVNYVPAATILVFATSLLESSTIFEMITGAAGAEVEQQLKSAEMMLGFSVQNDLIPALGNEFAFALNSIKMSGNAPTVDGAMIFKVRDKAKMQKVLGGLERLATNALAGQNAAASTDSTVKSSANTNQFKEEKVGEATVRYVELPIFPGLAPGYVLDGDYLVIGSTLNGMKSAVENKGGTNNLPGSPAMKELGPSITTTGNVFQYLNFDGVWETATALSRMFPAAQGATKYIEALKVLKTAAGVSRVQEGALISEGVLLLQ